jgi:hypothetical protein
VQRLLPNWPERLRQIKALRSRFGVSYEMSDHDFTRFTPF